ncbi:hypothetical protein ISN44_As01g004100 [Arabidopsis suecica]|uniref:NYN domain-containing protein n=1 Tax=Arabidopsis suecica TaxID=45249 RepID=A0A8T2H1A5_ARASU|nr:hypothetical protein ISN44_As01g004100 [Arabidopsis suecica]
MTGDVKEGKISVLWDLTDFPVPEGRSIRAIVGSVLARKGYTGEISIKAYGETTNPYPPEDGFTFVHNSDKYWRLNRILVDICLWSLDSPAPYEGPATLMVVAKNIEERSEFVAVIQNLKASGYNTIFVVPDGYSPYGVPIPKVNLAWYWKSLLEGGEPIPDLELQGILLRVKQHETNVF